MKIILIIFFFNMLIANEKYKEPSFSLIDKENNIELRQYDEYVIARTSIPVNQSEEDNNMFRVLASYIFGRNEKNQSIPMTAPVTTYENNDTYDMIFYMLDVNNIQELPNPSGQNISLENFNLGKCAVISFSWFASKNKINKYTEKLKKYINDNGYTVDSPFMVNRYDPPWTLPFLRRNEILVKIK
tara:strand:+ start:107 stop:664 length:558 start_codon:yes stop_codon:yes gene_type:complete